MLTKGGIHRLMLLIVFGSQNRKHRLRYADISDVYADASGVRTTRRFWPMARRPYTALIDTAGDYAMAIHVGAPVPTINFRTDYLRPAMNTSLKATAKVRRAGRTVGVVDIDVTDDSQKLVAVGRGTYAGSAG